MNKDSLGDRMKGYENAYRLYLPRRLPVIIRVDGRAFHTLTKCFERPFDTLFHNVMVQTAIALCKEISGAKIAYTQSDEISILITNNDTIDTQPWFGNNLQKLVSLAASIATLSFNNALEEEYHILSIFAETDEDYEYLNGIYHNAWRYATFDARAFILPEDEICNYFVWRQQDATRNSIQAAAQALYSHKELHNKNQNDLQEMIFQKGINWNNYEVWQKRGSCIYKTPGTKIVTFMDKRTNTLENKEVDVMEWREDKNIPIFSQARDYINSFLPNNSMEE